MSGSESTTDKRGHCHAHCAIHKEPRAVLNRLEQAWVGAACTQGHRHFASIAEYDRLTCFEIGCHDTEGNTHVFEPKALQQFSHKQGHALAPGKSHAIEGELRHVAKAHR